MSKRLLLLLGALIAFSALAVTIASFIMPRSGVNDVVSPVLTLERTRVREQEVIASPAERTLPGRPTTTLPPREALRQLDQVQRQRLFLRFFGGARNDSVVREISTAQPVSPTMRGAPLQPAASAEPVIERETRRLSLRPFGLHRPGAPGVWLYIGSVIAWMAAMGIVMAIFPARIRIIRGAIRGGWKQVAAAALTGGIGYVFLAALGFLLTLILVGVPLALLLSLAAAMGTVLGMVAVGVALGGWLARLAGHTSPPLALSFVLGALLIFPLSLLPFVGWPLVALLAAVGFGAALLTRFGSDAGWLPDALQGDEPR